MVRERISVRERLSGLQGTQFRYNVQASRGYFSRVNRNQTWSFLFFNFPENWPVDQIWRLFKRYGDLVDVYMARKRLRNGQKFGFVRFKGVKSVEQMEQRLNTIWVGNFKVRVFYEGNKRSAGSRKGPVIANAWEATKEHRIQEGMKKYSSYAHAVKSNVEGDCGARRSNKQAPDSCHNNFIEWIPSKKITNFVDNFLIGKVAKLTHLESISNLCSAEGLGECHIKHLRGIRDYAKI